MTLRCGGWQIPRQKTKKRMIQKKHVTVSLCALFKAMLARGFKVTRRLMPSTVNTRETNAFKNELTAQLTQVQPDDAPARQSAINTAG